MNLRALSYFIAVVDKGSISGAAKHCYIAQPSISSAVAQLETELSTQLFHRHGKGVSPTDSGLRLYPLAKKLLNESEAISQMFNQPVDRPAFKLGLIRSLGVQRMSQLLKDFTTACPNLELTLVEPNEEANARIITSTELTSQEAFHPIWHDKYQLAIPQSMPLSLKSAIHLADLDGQAFIYRTPCEAQQQLQQLMDLEGVQVQIRARIQTIEYALGLVSAGLGIALVPALPLLNKTEGITLRPLVDIELKRTVGLALPTLTETDPHQIALQKLCQRYT